MSTMFRRQLDNAIRLAIRRSPLAGLLRRFFRPGPLDKAIRHGRRHGWDAAAQWLLSPAGASTLDDPGLHESLRHSINKDIEIEFLLTALRKELVLGPVRRLDAPLVRKVLETLIRQCMNNAHVWFVSDEEQEVREKLRAIASEGGDWRKMALSLLYHRPAPDAAQPPPDAPRWFTELHNELVSETREEAALRIPRFGSIENPTSRKIGNRYEESPYPRWLELTEFLPEGGRDRLADFFAPRELEFMDGSFQVLVAGCGTGRKAIQYALSYGETAQVLAVDLSRASLAYAMRMARRYEADNLEFLQMDLLELPRMERTFDIVECTGVLHHMTDPVEGGRAVVSRLRPGGVAHISLYSHAARSEVVTLRQEYGLHGEMSPDEIRERRRTIMQERPDAIEERLCLPWDFFDLHRCRDLLFHPLEHRFDIPRVGRFLEALGLEFRGLERPGILRDRYWTRFPPAARRQDLDSWHEFELAYPMAFGSLYEIWALKKMGEQTARSRTGAAQRSSGNHIGEADQQSVSDLP